MGVVFGKGPSKSLNSSGAKFASLPMPTFFTDSKKITATDSIRAGWFGVQFRFCADIFLARD